MDMLVYIFIILIVGFGKVYSTRSVSSEASIVNDNPILESAEVSMWENLPVGDNLRLVRDPYAYHYILYDLGLEEAK